MCLSHSAHSSPDGFLVFAPARESGRGRDKVWNCKNNKISTCIAVQWKTLARIRRRIWCQSGESAMTEKAGTGYFHFFFFHFSANDDGDDSVAFAGFMCAMSLCCQLHLMIFLLASSRRRPMAMPDAIKWIAVEWQYQFIVRHELVMASLRFMAGLLMLAAATANNWRKNETLQTDSNSPSKPNVPTDIH